MSLSNKKILTSGCGFSFSRQERKTWINVLNSVGANIIDASGPAVSNQWVLNKAFVKLLETKDTTSVIIQLTSVGKLDVEVDDKRQTELVSTDSLRNFTINNVWPSSHSIEHKSKKLYNQWLSSPGLETEDIFCKLLLIHNWCTAHQIELFVLQAYPIPWTSMQLTQLKNIVVNLGDPLNLQYKNSSLYAYHDFLNQNTVPCLLYQIELAKYVSRLVEPAFLNRIEKIQKHYSLAYPNVPGVSG
jgi:hypothetical protein